MAIFYNCHYSLHSDARIVKKKSKILKKNVVPVLLSMIRMVLYCQIDKWLAIYFLREFHVGQKLY